MYREDKFVVMIGGLHIEMAALRTLGDWRQGSDWVEALRKDVRSLVKVMEELGNPFEEDSEDLLVLDRKEIAEPSAAFLLRRHRRLVNNSSQHLQKNVLWREQSPLMTQSIAIS